MKEPIIKIIIIFAVMSACAVIAILSAGAKAGAPARGLNVASNENFEVVYLFEIEGVKIYRFRDAGRYRYFSTGNGSFLPSTQTVGKSYHSDGVENR